jgi:protein-tyrosine phosphatase
MSTQGFIDLHCHLLHGLDDGAKTVDESLAMARALSEVGFSQIAPSPHAWPELPDWQEAGSRREALAQLLAEAGVSLELHPNAENRLDAELFERIGRGDARALGTGRYLLVEAPFQFPLPSLLDLIFRLQLKGFTPLFAHPERCLEFTEHADRGAEAVAAGAALQLDIGALIGRYGRTAQRTAERLLDDGLYAVAATDLHGPVGAASWIERSLVALRRKVGETTAEALLREGPGLILRGSDLPVPLPGGAA